MEAAGLALAIFPLLISTIENWESCFQSTRSLLHWKKELKQIARQLSVQHVTFVMNLQALLTPIVGSAEEIAKMLEEPGSDLWKGSRGLELSKRLGMASPVYRTTVEDCERILRELSNRCNLLQENQWNFESIQEVANTAKSRQRYNGTFDSLMASVKYLARKKILVDLIQELRQNNENLITLLQLADSTQAGRNVETPTKRITGLVHHFETVRQTAIHLHQTLAKHIHCSKHLRHSVKLELAGRDIEHETLSEKRSYQARDEEKVRFRIIFMAHNYSAGNEVALRVFEMKLAKEAFVSIDNENGDTDAGNVSKNSSTVGLQRLPSLNTDSKSATKKSVKFQLDASQSNDDQDSESSKHMVQIQDLCSVAGSILEHHDFCLDLVVSGKKLLRNINCRERSSTYQYENFVSLFDLIRLHTSKIHKLSVFKRLGLATRVAASLLHLHTSPWLGDSYWTSKDIFVGIGSEGVVSSPYVAKPFVNENSITTIEDLREGTSTNSLQATIHSNPFVFTVGMLLLELGLGKPIELLAGGSENTIATATEAGLLTMALQALGSKYCREKLTGGYRKAIQVCITGVFQSNCKQFHDPEFREEYCREVVEPILKEYQAFNGRLQ